MKKAIICDNSGTLLERHRAIKDIESGKIFTNVNSLDLIVSNNNLSLVVLQFNTVKLQDFPRDMLISDVIYKLDIDFDVSFSLEETPINEISDIIYNDKIATVSDIVDCFSVLKDEISNIELCNGSALIVDVENRKIKYTITSAGRLFSSVRSTIAKLQDMGVEIFIASGDRKKAIEKLAILLNINSNNAFGSVSTKGKCQLVKCLKAEDFEVLMVGDGFNDLMAFGLADISVLTIEQGEDVSDKLLDKTDFVIKKFSELISIVERW